MTVSLRAQARDSLSQKTLIQLLEGSPCQDFLPLLLNIFGRNMLATNKDSQCFVFVFKTLKAFTNPDLLSEVKTSPLLDSVEQTPE